ncbi:hypothetical protein [Plastoroseomonas arctica]|uniref:Uncharacterized protein n=1 Tax=Plastoroseomonas arctica TaxID=1509237 RepID=A0AAF1K7R6_9PROT|nr:hypothetical protein [Plastoroseomonas arctica]MBR0657201.1 hypothetical protein [Plastoroseomonas arctica]
MARHIGWLMLALAATAGPALAQVKAPAAGGGERVAVLERLPERIGSFARSGPVRQDTTANVEDGAILRYQGASGFMTVFLYRMGGPAIPNGTESPIVQAELAGSERSMLNTMAQPGPDGIPRAPAELITGYAFAAPDGPRFRCVEARRAIPAPQGAGGGWHQHEHVCVTGHMQGYLKMRVTYRAPDPEGERVRDAVQALVGGAAAAVR